MSKLPRISGRECVRALEKAGFFVRRQEVAGPAAHRAYWGVYPPVYPAVIAPVTPLVYPLIYPPVMTPVIPLIYPLLTAPVYPL